METFDNNQRELKKNEARRILDQQRELNVASSDEELGVGDYLMDIAAAVPRGIESGVKDIYHLLDDTTSWAAQKITGNDEADILPDYEDNFFGESKTGVGKALQTIIEWGTIFIPVSGQVGVIAKGGSVISKLGKAGKVAQKVAKVTGKFGLGTGAIADAVMQQRNDGTLSNMLQDAGFDNALTEFMATDEDDSVLEVKLKAALEGALLGGAVLGVSNKLVSPIFKSLKHGKAIRKAVAGNMGQVELDNLISKNVLNSEEVKAVQSFVKQREVVEESATKLLKDPEIKEVKAALEDFNFDVKSDDVVEIAKTNYKNVVKVNDELTDTFVALKDAEHYDHEGLLSLLDNAVKLREVTSLQGKSLQALKGQAAASRDLVLKDSKALKTFKESVKGYKKKTPEELREFSEILTGLDSPKELRSFLNQTLTKTSDNMLKKSGMMLQEFWRNALLSGTGTHVLNLGSNAFRIGYDKFSTVAKGAFKGDATMMKQGAVEFRALFTHALESGRLAFKAARKNFARANPEGIIDKSSSAFIDTAKNQKYLRKWSKQYVANDSFGTAAEYIGNIVNIPTTMLSATDEMFKQLAVRSKLEGKFFTESVERGLKGADAETFIKSQVDKAMMDTGEIVNREALFKRGLGEAKAKGITTTKGRMEFANKYVASTDSSITVGMKDDLIEYARQMTYQNKVGPTGTAVLKFANEHPMTVGWFLPFVKTPMNVLSTGIREFTPIQSVIDLARGSLFSADAAIKAEAQARFAVATVTTGSVLGLINNGGITGSGPKNAQVRANLTAAGWQPYSIKVGDTYISYRRLDPIATPIGLIADMFETYNEGLIENADAGKLINATIVSMMENVSNKSYLQGITNFVKMATSMNDPEGGAATRLASQFIGSLTPAIIANANGMVSGSDPLVQVRSIFDGMKARLGFDEGLEIKRNLLGEELNAVESTSALHRSIIPARVSKAGKDSVSQALADSGLTMGQPSYRMNGVDLRQIEIDGSKSAYSGYLDNIRDIKIGGKNLRSALQRLTTSAKFKRAPDESSIEGQESARATMLKAVISRYRTRAKTKLIRDTPELKNKISLKRDLRGQVRKGKITARSAIERLLETQ